jgi:murein tripeptide amidase MpaA
METMANYKFDKYHNHKERTAILQDLAKAHPNLAQLSSIGTSHQGREIWAMEITNRSTAAPEDKPGFYIDANCHGEEIIGSEVALYTIWHLLTHYGQDSFVTLLLDNYTFYILPQINPDGAEWSLTTPYHHVGNGHYPFWEEPYSGHRVKDLNDDGYIVDMRVKDPAGEWKVSDQDPRLMILRKPGEMGGTYYRVYPEGEILDYDGVSVEMGKPRHGNLNRQYPAHWAPEEVEYGAGKLPLNEPEAKAIADFILAHSNIVGAQAYHSHGGVILRQSSTMPDRDLPPEDVRLFKHIGTVGEEITSYPLISTFEDFTMDTHNIRHGGFCDWLYQWLGLVPFTTELWDVETAAGVEKTQFFMERGRSETEQLKLLAWADEHCPDEGFIDWEPFEHPQLGPVEIGGWNRMFVFRNPPAKFIEEIARPNAEFTFRHAASAPLIRIQELKAIPVDKDMFRVEVVVGNEGYLPTNLTDKALELDVIPAVWVCLDCSDNVELIMGDVKQDLGHLAGYSERRHPWNAWGPSWNPTRAQGEWLIRVPEGVQGSVQVLAVSEKGGRVSQALVLER